MVFVLCLSSAPQVQSHSDFLRPSSIDFMVLALVLGLFWVGINSRASWEVSMRLVLFHPRPSVLVWPVAGLPSLTGLFFIFIKSASVVHMEVCVWIFYASCISISTLCKHHTAWLVYNYILKLGGVKFPILSFFKVFDSVGPLHILCIFNLTVPTLEIFLKIDKD